MGIFKFLPLLCLMVATGFAIRVPLCRPKYGQEDGSAGSNEICLCTTGSPTIINKIDAEHFGVERLVIYVYRKPNTGETISFIPEREYQRRIPDFPEDYGIVEDISYNPSILDIFDDSPSKDIRKYTDGPAPIPKPKQPDVIAFIPNDVDIGNEQPQGPEINTINPHWQIPVTKPSEVEDTEFPKWPTPLTPSDAELAEIIAQPKREPGTEYETTDEPVNPQESPIYVTPGYEYVEPNRFVENPVTEAPVINYPAYPHVSPIHSVPQHAEEEHYPDGETPGEGEPSESPTIHTDPLNPPEYPQVPDDSVEDNQGGYLPSNTGPLVKPFRIPVRDNYGRIIGWTTTTHASNTYWEKGRHTPPFIKYDPSSHYDIGGQGIPSFDYWLEQQLKLTTLHGNRVPTSTSDIVALHTAIRNLLLQNGFVVTRHGTLTDGYGKVISLTNLKLRPIFIGKSVSYDHFMQGGGVKFKIPTDTPFLEGLLLTMIKPAKILGIVPLKITSLPDELSPEHKDKKFTIHGNPVGQKASFKVLPIEDLVSFRKDSKGKKRRPRPHSTKIPNSNKHKNSALLQQALLELSKPGKDRVRGKELEKGIISEEKPDFRIIGGASATSSGTPLLFKGRSGNLK